MAMLSARFRDADAARQVRDTFINAMGATPDLVITTVESARPGAPADAGTRSDAPTAMPTVESTRLSIYDDAVDTDAAREVMEAAGGTDIRPIQ